MKNVNIITQRYNTMSRKFGRRVVGTISVDINGVRARKWNSDRVIVFQSVILQRVQGVNNAKHICVRIFFRINNSNHGAFDKIVKYTFNAATGLLAKSCGIQSEEQQHSKFSHSYQKENCVRRSDLLMHRKRESFPI